MKDKIQIHLQSSKERMVKEINQFIDGRIVAMNDSDVNPSIPLESDLRKGQIKSFSDMKEFMKRFTCAEENEG
jgi:hypothetical protein